MKTSRQTRANGMKPSIIFNPRVIDPPFLPPANLIISRRHAHHRHERAKVALGRIVAAQQPRPIAQPIIVVLLDSGGQQVADGAGEGEGARDALVETAGDGEGERG